MKAKYFFPLLIFLFALLLLPVSEVRAAPSFTSVTVYVWWQGDGNFTPTMVMVGDRVMLKFTVSGFTRIYSPTVKDPQGNTLPVKNSTWTVSPYYLWFNTTSLAGAYTVSLKANDTSTNTVTTYSGQIMVYSYQVPTATIKGADVNGAIANLYQIPTLSGNISVSATFFSINANGSVTATVPCSAATPFKLQLLSGTKVLYSSDWIHPKGVQSVTLTFQYPISNSTMSLYGANSLSLSVVPYYGTGQSASLGTVYFVPAEDFSKATASFSAVAPSSAHIGDLFNLTPQLKLTSTKTLVGGQPAYPVVLNFLSPQKGAVMWPSDAKGNKLILLNNTNNQIAKFVGDLPAIGSNTLEIYPITLKSFLAGQFSKMIDSSGKYVYASSTVTILPDGTFSIQVLNSTGKVPSEVHPEDTVYMNVTWTRSKYWIYSGDSYSFPVVADTEISSYPYHKGFGTLSASNGTTAKVQITMGSVNQTFSSLSGTATPYLRLKDGTTLASGSAVQYKFAGYNIKFMYQGQPYTPSSSAPIDLKIFYSGNKIYERNITTAYVYFYGPKSASAVAGCTPSTLSKLSGSATLSGAYGTVTDVVIQLSSVAIPVGPYEYIPKAYTDKISVAIRASLQPNVVYSLYNNLTALTDIVADSPKATVAWDAAKKVATITVTDAGTYTFTYDASGTYVDDMPIATIKDQNGNLVSQVKLKLVDFPGYEIKVEPVSSDEIKISLTEKAGAFPIAAGKSIRLDVGPTVLTLVKVANATKVYSYSDYSWYIEPSGYVIYKIPAGPAGTKVVVSANATLPLDFSPALSLYNWVISSELEVTAQPSPTVAGVSTNTLILLMVLVLIAIAAYVAIKK